jgi:hypothetical protein
VAGAAPVAGPVADGDLLERLRAEVAAQKPMLKEALRACRLEVSPDGAAVRLSFDGLGRMHRDRLEAEATKVFLRELIRSLRGAPCSVELAFGKESAPPAQARPADARERGAAPPPPAPRPGGAPLPRAGAGPEAARPEPGPLAERIRKRFDGRYLEQE